MRTSLPHRSLQPEALPPSPPCPDGETPASTATPLPAFAAPLPTLMPAPAAGTGTVGTAAGVEPCRTIQIVPNVLGGLSPAVSAEVRAAL